MKDDPHTARSPRVEKTRCALWRTNLVGDSILCVFYLQCFTKILVERMYFEYSWQHVFQSEQKMHIKLFETA
jgi:hypothetical protein